MGDKIKTIRELSSGGVVLDPICEDARIILISRRKAKTSQSSKTDRLNSEKVWCLPKGKIEKSEDSKQAALREVNEETGIKTEIIEKIDKINYWYFKEKGVRCYKTVYFYMMKVIGGKIDACNHEVVDVKWYKIDKALTIMSYDSEKDMVRKVKQKLGRRQ